MKRVSRLIIGLGVAMFVVGGAFAASDTASHDVTLQVQEVALLALNDATTLTLTIDGSGISAGDSLNSISDSDSTRSLAYTSLVQSGLTRSISAAVGTSVPGGTQLLLEATSVASGCGTAQGQITLGTTATDVVTGIGSCNTGGSPTALTYTFDVVDSSLLSVANSTITVTYTLTEDG
jgi:hypothetical protein